MNAKEITLNNLKLNTLIYGKTGTGKTPFACFYPKPYVFDFDNGMLSVRGCDVEYDTFSKYEEFRQKVLSLENKCPYDTLILDSITTMEEYCMDNALAANNRTMPTLNEWNIVIAEIKDVVMRLTQIAKHTIIIAHEQMMQDEITGEILIRPQVAGKKLPVQLPLWFDEVYHTEVRRGKDGIPTYAITTVADSKYIARSRIHCLPTIMDWSKDGKMINPFDMILAYVEAAQFKK